MTNIEELDQLCQVLQEGASKVLEEVVDTRTEFERKFAELANLIYKATLRQRRNCPFRRTRARVCQRKLRNEA